MFSMYSVEMGVQALLPGTQTTSILKSLDVLMKHVRTTDIHSNRRLDRVARSDQEVRLLNQPSHV